MSSQSNLLKTFPSMVAAAGAGSVLAFLGRVAVGLDWTVAESMMRERLFVVGLDSMLIAVLAGLLAMFLARGNTGRAFLIGLACGVGPWSWTAFAGAVVLVAAVWKFMPKIPAWATWGGGVLAFGLAPTVWLTPTTDTLMPYKARPEMAPLVKGLPMPSAGSPDVVMIVCDTLRADDILNPDVPTPNLDELRATGTWSKAAVAPANQTLPSHLSLLFALDIENVGMRSNRSRWPSRKALVEERGALSLAERFGAAGYRTQAVVTNKLLSTTKAGAKPEDNQWVGEGFDTWYDISRQPSTQAYLRWVESSSLIGFLGSNQIVLKKRPLNYFLKRLLIPPSANGYRLHFQEGETTVVEVQRSLAELTADDRPYFLFVNFMEPHAPYLPPPEFAGTLALAANRPDNFKGSVHDEVMMRRQMHVGALGIKPKITPDIYLPTAAYLHNLYREEVAYFDSLLGRTLASIRATGRPTTILFVSDHGEGFGTHHDPAHGHTLFESEMRVPFILNGAGVPAGMELPFTPELVDGSFTLLELAGINTDAANGRNVLDPAFQQRATLTFRRNQISSFDGRWKLHANFQYDNDSDEARAEGKSTELNQYQLEPLFLFDFSVDPGETNNLLEQHPKEAERLLAAIRTRLQHDLYPQLDPRSLSAAEQADLDALGYAEQGDDSASASDSNNHDSH